MRPRLLSQMKIGLRTCGEAILTPSSLLNRWKGIKRSRLSHVSKSHCFAINYNSVLEQFTLNLEYIMTKQVVSDPAHHVTGRGQLQVSWNTKPKPSSCQTAENDTAHVSLKHAQEIICLKEQTETLADFLHAEYTAIQCTTASPVNLQTPSLQDTTPFPL